MSFLLGTECVPGLAIIKSKHYKKISQNAQTLSALIMLFCSLLMKKDKDYVTYLLDILIFLAPKKNPCLKNACYAAKSVSTNICCESTINNVLDCLISFRDLMCLFVDKKVRIHSWKVFGCKFCSLFPSSSSSLEK